MRIKKFKVKSGDGEGEFLLVRTTQKIETIQKEERTDDEGNVISYMDVPRMKTEIVVKESIRAFSRNGTEYPVEILEHDDGIIAKSETGGFVDRPKPIDISSYTTAGDPGRNPISLTKATDNDPGTRASVPMDTINWES